MPERIHTRLKSKQIRSAHSTAPDEEARYASLSGDHVYKVENHGNGRSTILRQVQDDDWFIEVQNIGSRQAADVCAALASAADSGARKLLDNISTGRMPIEMVFPKIQEYLDDERTSFQCRMILAQFHEMTK